jgi:NADPH:quinone reductase-like Zn-dependent oxidoreductase
MPTLTMRASHLHRYGPPELLHIHEVPRPVPADGEMLVRIHAAGVNAIDWKIRAGYLKDAIPYQLPLILGLDFSGVAEGNEDAGEIEVYGRIDLMRLGTYAEYVVARAGEFTAKPASIDHVHAAAVPLAALTAWQGLIAGAGGVPSLALAAGQRVLIHGAAGGVGSMAVQLAKWRGAEVVATASAEDLEFVRGLGADQVIDYRAGRFEDVAGEVDAVLDLIGGETQTRSWPLIRKGGALASTMGQPPEEQAAAHGVRAIGVNAVTDTDQLDEIAELIDEGALRPAVSDVFSLADAAQAHARLEAGRVQGKVVLRIV